ncbi:hypothetical protein V2J09_007294 [Rumex salicifolius]
MGRTEEEEEEEKEEEEVKRGCRPLAFLLGLPFALCAVLLSLAAAIVWILGSLLSYVCPCLGFCADLANKAMDLIQLPMNVMRSTSGIVKVNIRVKSSFSIG